MPRPSRIESSTSTYHVFSRGNNRGDLFYDAIDHVECLRILASVVARCEWELFSYCLMTNHYHLLLRTPKANLAEGMQRLNFVYARRFNRRHGRLGHAFERRYSAERVETEGHLLETSRYIEANPVRAGLCEHPLDWPWSSCAALCGETECPSFLKPDWLLWHFGPKLPSAQARYRQFVEDGVRLWRSRAKARARG